MLNKVYKTIIYLTIHNNHFKAKLTISALSSNKEKIITLRDKRVI